MLHLLAVIICLIPSNIIGLRVFKNESYNAIVEESADMHLSYNSTPRHSFRRLTSDDHLVHSLPGLDPKEKIVHYAGHILVDNTFNGNLFYWLFETPNKAEERPLIIWLNGGPGCSSMDGLWLELGPFRLKGDAVHINPHSWHNVANLLFIDQPFGTGLSYTDKREGLCKNDDCIRTNFYSFLEKFFELHSRYITTETSEDGSVTKRFTRPVFITGESHAGHYIPIMAKYILEKNKEVTQNGGLVISLEAVALGNPWMEPRLQYDVTDFAKGMGILPPSLEGKMDSNRINCQNSLNKGKLNEPNCFKLLDDVVAASKTSQGKIVMYDIRKRSVSTAAFPPGHEALERYLNKPDVKRALHAESQKGKYLECADPPFYALSHQDGKGVSAELVSILNQGLRVLVYSGQFDLVCHFLGNEKVLSSLPWSGQSQWIEQTKSPGVWYVDKKPAGFVKAFKNLQSLVVLDSGHMVPMDLPAIALEMVTRFIENKGFYDESTKKMKVEVPLLRNVLIHATARRDSAHRLRGTGGKIKGGNRRRRGDIKFDDEEIPSSSDGDGGSGSIQQEDNGGKGAL